jgi:hypothetical protein
LASPGQRYPRLRENSAAPWRPTDELTRIADVAAVTGERFVWDDPKKVEGATVEQVVFATYPVF